MKIFSIVPSSWCDDLVRSRYAVVAFWDVDAAIEDDIPTIRPCPECGFMPEKWKPYVGMPRTKEEMGGGSD